MEIVVLGMDRMGKRPDGIECESGYIDDGVDVSGVVDRLGPIFMCVVWAALWTLLVFLTNAEHPILTVFIVGFLLPLVLYIGAIWIASRFRNGPDKR